MTLNWTDKNTGDQLSAVEINNIAGELISHSDLFSTKVSLSASQQAIQAMIDLRATQVSLGNLDARVESLEGFTDDDTAYASKVSLGQIDLRVSNLEGATDDDSAFATQVSLGNVKVSLGALDTRVTSIENNGGGYSDSDVASYLVSLGTSITPDTNSVYDLGSAEKKFRHLYLSSNSLYLGDEDTTDPNLMLHVSKTWLEGRASTVSLGNIKVSLGNIVERVVDLENVTDDDSAFATKVSLGQLDTRVSGLETLSAYTISTLPESANDGTQALVSDGVDTGVALAYHYDRAWYRSLDNVVLADSKWSPADTTTQLWYDASDLDSLVVSGTDLTQWGDKSGNGYHLTKDQNASDYAQSGIVTLRGRNVIEFGIGDSMTNLDWSFNQNTSELYIAIVWQAYVDGVQDFILHHTTSTASRQALRRTSSNGFQWLGSDTSGTSRNLSLNNVSEGGDNISSFKINESSSWLANYNATGKEFTSGNTGNNPLAHISIGSNEIESSELIGYFAEIVYYTDANDVTKIEGYLAHKWGLSGYLTDQHEYKDSAP